MENNWVIKKYVCRPDSRAYVIKHMVEWIISKKFTRRNMYKKGRVSTSGDVQIIDISLPDSAAESVPFKGLQFGPQTLSLLLSGPCLALLVLQILYLFLRGQKPSQCQGLMFMKWGVFVNSYPEGGAQLVLLINHLLYRLQIKLLLLHSLLQSLHHRLLVSRVFL